MFSRANSANPLDRMGLEREIYFGEILIATNDIASVRKKISGLSLNPSKPSSIGVLSRNMISVERLFMAMSPALDRETTNRPYVVQIAIRQELAVKFDDRFPKKSSPSAMHVSLDAGLDAFDSQPTNKVATLVMPWITGEHLSGFVDSVSH